MPKVKENVALVSLVFSYSALNNLTDDNWIKNSCRYPRAIPPDTQWSFSTCSKSQKNSESRQTTRPRKVLSPRSLPLLPRRLPPCSNVKDPSLPLCVYARSVSLLAVRHLTSFKPVYHSPPPSPPRPSKARPPAPASLSTNPRRNVFRSRARISPHSLWPFLPPPQKAAELTRHKVIAKCY